MTLEMLREFFFWNMLINVVLLLFSFVMILAVRKLAYRIHGSIFRLTESQLDAIWYSIFGFYKILVFVFGIVPYAALRVMTM